MDQAIGAKTAYIERGSPWENGYIESFNARLRDELLDGEIFYSLREAHAPRITRLQTTSTRSVRTRARRVASCATSTGSADHAGAQTNFKLKCRLDHPVGADQSLTGGATRGMARTGPACPGVKACWAMKKRIILLLDGTWNDADEGPADTNIVRLRERIVKYFAKCTKTQQRDKIVSQQALVMVLRQDDGTLNLIFYERGVGTGWFLDRFSGGAFGAGLPRNIRRAYMFLARNYEFGDEVYIFGFSRGSYTARSLTGLIGTVGLLDARACTVENEFAVWFHYETASRMHILRSDIAAVLRSPSHIQIKCIGVFDTVGALGVPVHAFRRENRDLHEFHDVGLSPICEHSLHAVAIDEHRGPFEATLWRGGDLTKGELNAEQVWFAGAHGDIGGGYIDEQQRAEPALDDITLDWMTSRICKISKNTFPIERPEMPDDATKEESFYLAPQHDWRRGIYHFLPSVWRSLYNVPVPIARPLERNVCYDRHAEGIGEAIHVSAICRLGHEVRINSTRTIYSPRNLLSVIESRKNIEVVGWSGEPLSSKEAKRAIVAAVRRLGVSTLPAQVAL